MAGSRSLHQSSEVFGDKARITAVMTFADVDGFKVSKEVHAQNLWNAELAAGDVGEQKE